MVINTKIANPTILKTTDYNGERNESGKEWIGTKQMQIQR
jgi:hypothetical protein